MAASAANANSWRDRISRVVAELEKLNHSTEEDFLAVGRRLMQFRASAGQIDADIAALTELVSGEQQSKTAEVLGRILQSSKDLDARVGASRDALDRLHGLSLRVPQILSGLRERVLLFRTLCTLTRIETTVLGASGVGFDDLAEAVKPLSETIQHCGELVLEGADELRLRVQLGLQTGNELQARQLVELENVIGKLLNSFRSCSEQTDRARVVSAEQSEANRRVCQALDEVVQAIQFHDITRQQLEHVVDSLRQLFSGQEHNNGDELQSASDRTRAVLTLQCSQLRNTGEVFASSSDRIRDHLRSIVTTVREMAAVCRSLVGVGGQTEQSFFLEMENCCSEVLNSILRCQNESGQIQSIAAELAATIARMRAPIGEIRALEIEIQRIALNANIRAAQIGDGGNALNIISETMQRLVSESRSSTEDVSGVLDEMELATSVVGADLRDLAAAATIADLRGAMAESREFSESSTERLNDVAAAVSLLGDDIESVLAQFQAARLFKEVIDRARDDLIESGAAPAGAGEPVDSGMAQCLQDFSRHYTMAAEREIHQEVTAGKAGCTSTPEPDFGSAPQQEGVFGDNVELF